MLIPHSYVNYAYSTQLCKLCLFHTARETAYSTQREKQCLFQRETMDIPHREGNNAYSTEGNYAYSTQRGKLLINPNRLMSRFENIRWPPCSPHLTTLAFFFGGTRKKSLFHKCDQFTRPQPQHEQRNSAADSYIIVL